MDNFYLPPLPHAVGVIPAMCTHEDTAALRVHETLSWTGDDYTIDNALTGEPVLRVKGHVASLRGRKDITDAAGTPLFELRNELFTLRRTFTARVAGSDQLLFKVQSKFFTMNSTMNMTYMNKNTGAEETLYIRGDWRARSGQIHLGSPEGPVVATITNKGGFLKGMFARSTYILYVAPGGDLAMLTALCICLDDSMFSKS